MRKVASLVAAVVASFAFAGAASALMTAAITGSNTPGTNVYTLTMSWATSDNVAGVLMGVTTTGVYTGVFTDGPGTPFGTNFGGPVTPAGTGGAGTWGFTAGGPQPGGTVTLGTVEITVVAGQTIDPRFNFTFPTYEGFITGISSFTTVLPNGPLTGVTIIPEPTTAALLGLGIAGLVLAGRRSRA